MTKRMLIDAVHAEETRVVVVDGQRIEELDFESQSKRQLRGNIYLAKVTRVEPSLQAAFVEYGGNRHGFLAFNEIHPDYYQIPVADREALMREEAEEEAEHEGADLADEDEADEAMERRRRRLMRRYKIQEVIKRRQIMLVQVVKEERGNKGAALTAYLSLAGRYCVLMPNTARGGGISRKITSATDRKRLKSAAQSLELPQGMGLIIRTAGASRTKAEIKRDYEYLLRLWENIRDKTLASIAPALIYEEEDLVKRAIRDMFDKDFDGVEVEGDVGYREARDFMRMIMPSQAKKITHYTDPTPLFVKHKIEDQISQIHSPVVQLKSGGYLVINQTEALVAVDVNSGRSTRERSIEITALKTNLEAAEEAARQLRLRDLAGLIVIDFIDMDESKNNRAVEKKMKDCLADDRARIQMGKISGFGLMEISRQRRRAGVLEGSTHVCPHCQGMGRIRSVESSALAALRAIEMESVRGGGGAITLKLPTAVGLYVLNEKRAYLAGLDETHDLHVTVAFDDVLGQSDVEIERTESREGPLPTRTHEAEADDGWREPEPEADEDEDVQPSDRAHPATEDDEGAEGGVRRRRRRRRGRRDESDEAPREASTSGDEEEEEAGGQEAHGGEHDTRPGEEEGGHRRRRRRRGRRGGRRTREEGDGPHSWKSREGGDVYAWHDPKGGSNEANEAENAGEAGESQAAPDVTAPDAEAKPARKPRASRRKKDAEPLVAEPMIAAEAAVAEAPVETAPVEAAPADDVAKPKRTRSRRKTAAEEPVAGAAPLVLDAAPPEIVAPEPAETAPPPLQVVEITPEPEPEPAPTPAKAEPDPAEISTPPVKPRGGWWRRKA